MKLRHGLLVLGAFVAFAVGYGAVSSAFPTPYFRGFFLDDLDYYGADVMNPNSALAGCAASGGNAIPSSVNSDTEFIDFIECKLARGSTQDKVGAAFIIQTMIGGARDSSPSSGAIADWEARVRAASVTWSTTYSYSVNTFYQGSGSGTNPHDDAAFADSGSGAAILFRNSSGTVVYAIRRQCANPVGAIDPLPKAANFDIDGYTYVDNATPVPGDTIRFTHSLNTDASTSGRTISWTTENMPSGANIASGTHGPYGSAGTRPVSAATEDYDVPLNAVPGSQICRHIYFTPENENGGSDVSTTRCATVQYDYSLRPVIVPLVNGGPPVSGSVAEPGDTVQFQYAVINDGNTISETVDCTVYKQSITGYHPSQSPAESTSGWSATSAGTGCPRVFPRGPNANTSLSGANESIVLAASDANKSLCRVLTIDPSSPGGPPLSVEACIQVGAKPYMRVYGGDVSVGNGQPATCTSVSSGIIGWNKESATFAGAGAQYAVMAIGQINDFASTLGNAAGALPPSSLAFANTTTSGPNIFGGSFGSLPCIPDYYGRSTQMTTTALAGPNINLSALSGNNAYTVNGPITLSGNIAAGQRTVLFVNGDVLITGTAGKIGFPVNWTTANMPMFQLIAKGNIYVSQGVSELNGVYVAQPTNPTASNGVIFTCANTTLPGASVQTSDSAVYSKCRSKLTINGAFVAKQVQFLRTGGTLSASSAGEASSSPSIGEVFNYGPAFWMAQPAAPAGSAGEYDAITSLPPIL